jgi:hypothetical protein
MVMPESSLLDAAERWVVETYPYNSQHLIRSVEWLDRIGPGSRDAVRLATLTHDMERAFPGPDQPIATRLNDPAYYRAHSERSARIVGDWLREQGAADPLVRDVIDLVRVHEVGGWPEANLVQAADSLSFLDVNIDLFLGFARSGKYPVHDIGIKFDRSYERIQVAAARPLALPLLQRARARLAALEQELHEQPRADPSRTRGSGA